MPRRKIIGFGLSFLLLAATAGLGQSEFTNAQWSKPPAAGQKKGEVVKGTLRFDSKGKQVQFVAKQGEGFTIKYASIKSLLYERAFHARHAEARGSLWTKPLFFTKTKKHWFTIGYTDAKGAGKFAIVRLDKSNYQAALAAAEAETKKKAERVGQQ